MREWNAERRIQRREFKDYQPLFMLINSVDSVDEATRRDFIFINGPVWRRYNEVTRGARERRITVLFLSDEDNTFQDLLFVGCDAFKRREHRCRVMWSHPDWAVDEAFARQACISLAGRSVLRMSSLWPEPRPCPSTPIPPRLQRLGATAAPAHRGLGAPGLATP